MIIMRGSRLDDPATGEFDYAWCDPWESAADRYIPVADWTQIENALRTGGVREFTTVWDGDDFEIHTNLQECEIAIVHSGTAFAQARDYQQRCRDRLAETVRQALEIGISESQAARLAGVDRMTVRAWRAS